MEAAPPARLGEILSPERRAELNNSLNYSVMVARKVLAQVANRRLTSDQSEKAGLVKMFITQAESAKETDLAVAAQLAKRAQLLAESLAQSLP